MTGVSRRIQYHPVGVVKGVAIQFLNLGSDVESGPQACKAV